MKKLTVLLFGAAALFGGTLFAADAELLLKMDMSRTKGDALDIWVNNPAVNKDDKVRLCKDADGSSFLRTKNYIHYYFPKLFPVNETDTVIVTLKARGNGTIEPGYYIFDRMGGFQGPTGKKFNLKNDWQEFKFEGPVLNRITKGKIAYSSHVRPLIQTVGENLEFKDYAISVVRNPILKDWVVNMPASDGNVKPGDGFLSLPGNMEYNSPALLNIKVGDKLEFAFKVRGKGKIEVGYYAFDLKYNPNRKNDTFCGKTFQSEAVDSKDWKEVNFSIPIGNVEKDGKKLFVNRILSAFKTSSADGSAVEIQQATVKIVGEKISVPEF